MEYQIFYGLELDVNCEHPDWIGLDLENGRMSNSAMRCWKIRAVGLHDQKR